MGYPLQYSWASLVAQTVKNLPATWETWVRSLGWEDPLEKGKAKATHSSILAWRSPWTVCGCGKELDMTERPLLSLLSVEEAVSWSLACPTASYHGLSPPAQQVPGPNTASFEDEESGGILQHGCPFQV